MVENEAPTVITREPSIADNVLPTGRRLGVVPVRNTAMYQINYVDGKGGELPDDYKGRFTSIRYAQNELSRFVASLWDVSDKAASRSKKTISLNTDNAISR